MISGAIVGDPGNVRGKSVHLGTLLESEPILYESGIPQDALRAVLMHVRSGYKTFIEISKENALKLGVLEWLDVD